MAHGVLEVDELVVLGNPRVGLVKAAGDIVDAVGSRQGQLSVVKEVLALAVVDVLPLDIGTTALVGFSSGRLVEEELVPGIVGDVEGSAGLVDLEDVEAAALISELDADVVAVDGAGPVGNTVGVDVAADDADGRRVLLVGGDGSGTITGKDSGRDGDGSGGSEADEVAEGRHIWKE